MGLYVECPVCELKFAAPDVKSDPVECPGCARSFQLDNAAVVPPTAVPSNRLASRLSVPGVTESGGTVQAPIPVAASIPSESDVAKIRKNQATVDRHQRQRRKRKRLIKTLVSSAILAGIIGVLTGLLVEQLKKNPLTKNRRNAFPAVGHHVDPQPGEYTEDLNQLEAMADPQPATPPVEELRIAPEDIPPQEFSYWSRKQAADRWRAVQPHLVSLKVYDGFGTHDAVGTIVDSRGWILTSYRGIKDATKIEVKASVPSIDDYWDAKPLTDLVRGYIHVDKEADLAILSINRRFIVAFTFVTLARKNKIVEGQYLLQCAPPSRHNLYGATESQIQTRAEYEGLDDAGQSLVRRQQMEQTNLTWLVAAGSTRPVPGTPLFDTAGELAAISSFAPQRSPGNSGYFVPVNQVAAMIRHADPTEKPLQDLVDGSTGVVAVAESHEMYETSIRLNQLSETCQDFDWIPKQKSDFLSFQEFAAAFAKIERYTRGRTTSTMTADMRVIAQKNKIEKILSRRFANLRYEDELLLEEMNRRFASESLQEASQTLPLFGDVHYVDIVNARMIIRLRGTDSYALAPVSATGAPMRMQSTWLFFAETPRSTRSVNYRISTDELITAESVQRVWSFGQP